MNSGTHPVEILWRKRKWSHRTVASSQRRQWQNSSHDTIGIFALSHLTQLAVLHDSIQHSSCCKLLANGRKTHIRTCFITLELHSKDNSLNGGFYCRSSKGRQQCSGNIVSYPCICALKSILRISKLKLNAKATWESKSNLPKDYRRMHQILRIISRQLNHFKILQNLI